MSCRVRFFNEAYLLAEAAKSPTALILDIGHDVTRVVRRSREASDRERPDGVNL
jgi:hypothetical protein